MLYQLCFMQPVSCLIALGFALCFSCRSFIYRMSWYISHTCIFPQICLMITFDWIVKDWKLCMLLHSEYSITEARRKCAKHMHLSIHLPCLNFYPEVFQENIPVAFSSCQNCVLQLLLCCKLVSEQAEHPFSPSPSPVLFCTRL